jgi:hypothetical protein
MRRIGKCNGALDAMDDFRPVLSPILVPRKNDMAAARKQAGKAFECLAPHDHWRAHCQLLEAPQVGRQMPWKVSIQPNHAIIRSRDDQDNLWSVHTATGAEI